MLAAIDSASLNECQNCQRCNRGSRTAAARDSEGGANYSVVRPTFNQTHHDLHQNRLVEQLLPCFVGCQERQLLPMSKPPAGGMPDPLPLSQLTDLAFLILSLCCKALEKSDLLTSHQRIFESKIKE